MQCRSLSSVTRAVALCVSCGIGARAATQGPVAVNLLPNGVAEFQGFDPARGVLRCVQVESSLQWQAAGEMNIQTGLALVPASATFCEGASCAIGHLGPAGFVAHGAAGSCVEVSRTCSGPPFSECDYLWSVSGGTTDTDVVTGWAPLYVGPGLRQLRASAGYTERLVAITGSPGASAGTSGVDYSATPVFTLLYIYTPLNRCPGDVNGDGHIDFLGLNGVLGDYGLGGPCARGDVNNDNVVDFLDLNEVLSYYGQPCAAE